MIRSPKCLWFLWEFYVMLSISLSQEHRFYIYPSLHNTHWSNNYLVYAYYRWICRYIYVWTSDGYIRAPPYSNFSRVRNLTPKFWIIIVDNEQNYDLVLFVFSWKNLWLTWNISKSKNKWILIMLEISDYLRGRYEIYRDLYWSIMYVLPYMATKFRVHHGFCGRICQTLD